MATELGVAYVSILPSMDGFSKSLGPGFAKAEKSADEAGKKSGSKFGDGFKAAGLLAAAAAGAAIGAAASVAIVAALDIEKGNDKLAAQLGLTSKESEAAGKVAGKLYAGAYGESMNDVQGAVGAVMSSIEGMRTASSADVEAMTAKVMDLSAAFEIDATRAAQVAGQMITSGLAEDGVEAADLLTAALQKVPAAVREDILDATDEYGPFFSQLGIEGSDAMGMLVAAAEDGMYGIDKTGDAVKEFGIRATDMSKATGEAYDIVGLSQEDMTAKLLAGGDTAAVAFQDIIKGVQGIEDPVAQSQAALALFGTPLEDLSVTEIPKFLESLTGASGGLGDVKGAAEAMGDTLNDNVATKLEGFKRTIETSVVNFMGEKVIPAFEGMYAAAQPILTWLRDTMPIWGPFAAGIGLVVLAYAAWAGVTAILTAGLWAQAAAFVAANAPVIAVIAVIGLLVGAVIYAYNNIGWFRDLVDTAFAFIKTVISNVVKWFTDTAVPWFTNAVRILGDFFTKLWLFWIKPAFDFISWGVKTMWTIVDGIFQVMIAGLKFALGPAFKWFQDYVKPILDTVGRIIGDLWKKHVEPVFKWIGDGVKAIPAAFEVARDGIAKAWNAIKEIARGPVEFVINKVINDGLIGTFNKIPGVNIKRIALPPGFNAPASKPNPARGGPVRARAKGGYTPPGWTLVGEEGPELVNFSKPGHVYTASETAQALIQHDGHGSYAAPKASPTGAIPALNTGVPGVIASVGKNHAYVEDNSPGWFIPQAASIISQLSALKLSMGRTGMPRIQTHLSGSLPSNILGFASNNNATFNTAHSGMAPQMKKATAIHELLHVLGLAHTNAASIMNPVLGSHMLPTSHDRQQMERLYGKGNGGAIVDAVDNPFSGLVDTLMAAFKKAFPGAGMFVDAAGGLAKSGIESVVKIVTDIQNGIKDLAGDIWGNIKDFFGGGATTADLHDQGGWLGTGRSVIQNNTRKPEAILNSQQWSDISKLALREPSSEAPIERLVLDIGSEQVLARVVRRGEGRLVRA